MESIHILVYQEVLIHDVIILIVSALTCIIVIVKVGKSIKIRMGKVLQSVMLYNQ